MKKRTINIGILAITHVAIFSAEHPVYDVEKWKKTFPYRELFRNDYSKHYNSTPKDSPLDRRKPGGAIISTPKDLIQVIQVREEVGKLGRLKETSKSDVFVWGLGEPNKPYLTKIGGVPYRGKGKPWPQKDGSKMQFLFQVYFGDSSDLIAKPLPGKVMLAFVSNDEFWAGKQEDMHIEWASIEKDNELIDSSDVPVSKFYVPILHGFICRISEYSNSSDEFSNEGHDESFLLDEVQSTKIGSETHWIQGSTLKQNEHLFAVFSGPSIRKNPWPLVNTPEFKYKDGFVGYHGDQNELSVCMADIGCVYFIINDLGIVRWEFQCY